MTDNKITLERIDRLEQHLLNLTKDKAPVWQTGWLKASFILFCATFTIFSLLVHYNGMHQHFLSWGFHEGGDFISVYDKPIRNTNTYTLALILGVFVACTEKILKLGEKIVHGYMSRQGNSKDRNDFFVVLLCESASVFIGTVTTFLYFTNIAILMCVLLGRLLGALCIYHLLHNNGKEMDNLETYIGSLSF